MFGIKKTVSKIKNGPSFLYEKIYSYILMLKHKLSLIVGRFLIYEKKGYHRHICGFTMIGKKYRYIFFLHTKDPQIYKSKERVRKVIISILKLKGNELVNVWKF